MAGARNATLCLTASPTMPLFAWLGGNGCSVTTLSETFSTGGSTLLASSPRRKNPDSFCHTDLMIAWLSDALPTFSCRPMLALQPPLTLP